MMSWAFYGVYGLRLKPLYACVLLNEWGAGPTRVLLGEGPRSCRPRCVLIYRTSVANYQSVLMSQVHTSSRLDPGAWRIHA